MELFRGRYLCFISFLFLLISLVCFTLDLGAKLALITPAGAGFLLDIADIKVRVPAAAYKAAGDFVPTQQLMGNLFEQILFMLYDALVMVPYILAGSRSDIPQRRVVFWHPVE